MDRVLAHVGYVISRTDQIEHTGRDYDYFFSPLHNPNYLILIGAGILLALVLIFILSRSHFIKTIVHRLEHKMHTYHMLYPWMLRLAIGITLIGAGTSHVIVSPILPDFFGIHSLQIVLGFMIMAGFLVGPATVGAIFVYLFALAQNSYLFGNIDFLACALSLLFFANSIPGIDDIFNLKFFISFEKYERWAIPILRMGLGAAMLYLAFYEKILNPHLSEMVVREYNMTAFIPVAASMWVFGAGIIEFILAIGFILGVWTRLLSATAFVVLSSSFFFFNESVFSHITLFAILSILFVSGGGRKLFHRGGGEHIQ